MAELKDIKIYYEDWSFLMDMKKEKRLKKIADVIKEMNRKFKGVANEKGFI